VGSLRNEAERCICDIAGADPNAAERTMARRITSAGMVPSRSDDARIIARVPAGNRTRMVSGNIVRGIGTLQFGCGNAVQIGIALRNAPLVSLLVQQAL
jgi:hypothetical protein